MTTEKTLYETTSTSGLVKGPKGSPSLPSMTSDSNSDLIPGAEKHDGGKSPIYRGAINYFPRALELVALVSAFGAKKYAWGGWRHVDDGVLRYTDGLARHLNEEGKGTSYDEESSYLHAAHVAWNALARLELLLNEVDPQVRR